ncbi:MAG TPA: DoxX family protein, partial [Leptolinea sp.]
MNLFLWMLQGLLACLFAFTGVMKVTQTKEQLATRMAWVEDFSPKTIRWIGLAEILGAVGLILPGMTGIFPWLSAVAAFGLVLVMGGASF